MYILYTKVLSMWVLAYRIPVRIARVSEYSTVHACYFIIVLHILVCGSCESGT